METRMEKIQSSSSTSCYLKPQPFTRHEIHDTYLCICLSVCRHMGLEPVPGHVRSYRILPLCQRPSPSSRPPRLRKSEVLLSLAHLRHGLPINLFLPGLFTATFIHCSLIKNCIIPCGILTNVFLDRLPITIRISYRNYYKS